MWRSCLLMLLAAVWGASSFEDTSPFFYVSTTDSSKATSEIPQLVITDAVLRNLQPRLSKCSSDTYIIFVQPNVNAADYEARDAVPYLKESMGLGKGQNVKTKASFGVSDVLGALDTDVLEEYLRNTCRAEVMNVDASTGSFQSVDGMKPRVVRVHFPPLPLDVAHRARQLRDHDSFLSSVIDLLPTTKYTLIYTTTPLSAKDANTLRSSMPTPSHPHPHSHDDNNILPHHTADRHLHNPHTELKRDNNNNNNNNDPDHQPNITLVDGPLFQRYQFLSPGLFMGLLVSFLLLAILAAAMSALASLQVSYGAFEKEMGPAAAAAGHAQKKVL